MIENFNRNIDRASKISNLYFENINEFFSHLKENIIIENNKLIIIIFRIFNEELKRKGNNFPSTLENFSELIDILKKKKLLKCLIFSDRNLMEIIINYAFNYQEGLFHKIFSLFLDFLKMKNEEKPEFYDNKHIISIIKNDLLKMSMNEFDELKKKRFTLYFSIFIQIILVEQNFVNYIDNKIDDKDFLDNLYHGKRSNEYSILICSKFYQTILDILKNQKYSNLNF